MWRSIFLALGIFCIGLGAETLVVDKYLMADNRRFPRLINGTNPRVNPTVNPANQNTSYYQQVGYPVYPSSTQNVVRPTRIVQTKDWMPWSLLATGAIIVLYTCSLPSSRHRED